MSMLQFKSWVEKVDPYTILRITLYKALFIATAIVYVYWFFHPQNIISYVTPFMVLFYYESPIVSTFEKKKRLLLFMGGSLLFVNVTFDLVYPFKGIFFFYSLLVFMVLHQMVLKYFYAFKNLSLLIISSGALVLSTSPPANFQVSYDMIYSMSLSLITVMVCLQIVPNRYFQVWNRTLQHYIDYLIADIDASMQDGHYSAIQDEITRFEMVRNYQQLVEKKYLLPTFRVATYIRNIQLSLDNLFYEEKNEAFWSGVRMHLVAFKKHLAEGSPYRPQSAYLAIDTVLQQFVMDCLSKVFTHWNDLCVEKNN
ncbi:MAG: hypothetical protein CK423_00135 [Legionella sp.]|nr:MAG: hypothetical protein CK423_00135 [Legionella sp.]